MAHNKRELIIKAVSFVGAAFCFESYSKYMCRGRRLYFLKCRVVISPSLLLRKIQPPLGKGAFLFTESLNNIVGENCVLPLNFADTMTGERSSPLRTKPKSFRWPSVSLPCLKGGGPTARLVEGYGNK